MSEPAVQLLLGKVVHARLRPVRHRFVYPVLWVRVNVARLDSCSTRWFGVDRARLLSIRRRDYGPGDGSSLDAWMRAQLQEHGIAATGDIWLHTFPRFAGRVFNPVSFWHCHDAEGRLCAVLAEVNNTFGERHRYLLRMDAAAADGAPMLAPKLMHVSPFCPMEGSYRFRFRIGAERHCTSIDFHDAGGLLLATSLSGKLLPMTGRILLGALLRLPVLGLGIMARIHWQAFHLWRKQVPFFRKPTAHEPITTVHGHNVE
jgi:uncharacterized protein